jgi:vault protein inter-alpha-trypsin-like protein
MSGINTRQGNLSKCSLSALSEFDRVRRFVDFTGIPVPVAPKLVVLVEIAVSGVIADVKVVQTYRNEGSRPINASYVFPASTRAAVYAMRMRIGDQIVVAKIKEREAAKQQFDTAKKEGKSASLLEQNRPNVFSMSLANIMPQDQIEIELRLCFRLSRSRQTRKTSPARFVCWRGSVAAEEPSFFLQSNKP